VLSNNLNRLTQFFFEVNESLGWMNVEMKGVYYWFLFFFAIKMVPDH
jgi:hypothetical protein